MKKKQKIIALIFLFIFAVCGFVWINQSTVMNGEGTASQAVYYYGRKLENIKEDKSRFSVKEPICRFCFDDWAFYVFVNENGEVNVALCDYYDLLGSTYYWCKEIVPYGEVENADISTSWKTYNKHEYSIIKTEALTDELTSKENIKTEQFLFNGEEYTFLYV